MEKKEKKRLARVCVLAAAITLGSAWNVSGAQTDEAVTPAGEPTQESSVTTEESAGSDFRIEDGELVKYLGAGGDVVIPDKVTSIGDSAFEYCDSLVSVSIPGSVTSIGYAAFRYCGSLASVSIPGSVTGIGESAFYNCKSLTSVSISEGVESIGDSAFEHCDSLVSVSIPGSVTGIGYAAFRYCGSLASVSIPGSVTGIGYAAFGYCGSLASVSISEGVESIGERAFKDCDSLVSVSIPGSVTGIGDGAFSGCGSLTAIEVASGNQAYVSQNGVLFSKTGAELLAYPAGKKEEAYEIPGSVTGIGNSAFEDCDRLASVSIPGSVTGIGDRAFNDCGSLASVSISEGVESIGDFAFEYCYSLASVSIPGSVTSIGNSAFDSSVVIFCAKGSEAERYAKEEGNRLGAGDYNYRIKEDDTAEISGYTGEVAEIEIPSELDGRSVTSIGDSAFEDCDSLVSVSISEGVESIGDSAFRYCYSLASVSISEGVESIGERAFYDCDSLVSVSIPGSVTGIGYAAFVSCGSLTAIEVASGNQAYASQNGVLFSKTGAELLAYPAGKKEEAYEIPGSVTSIGYAAFEDCDSLVSMSIPGSVTGIGDRAFNDCGSLASVSISEGVTSIGEFAFYDCGSPASVSIPGSVTSIGYAAFSWDIVIFCAKGSAAERYAKEEGNRLGAGDYNYRLKEDWTAEIRDYTGEAAEIEIPSELNGRSVTGIGISAFYDCDSLTSVSIPGSVTGIGDSAFFNCGSLASVSISEGVESIGDSAFRYCYSLASVSISEGVESIGDYAFYGCDSLASVSISEGVESIGDYAFYGCDSLVSVSIPGSVTSIGEDAFDSSVVIFCGKGSAAESYAKENGNPLGAGDYIYRIKADDAAEISGYTGEAAEIEIPSELDGRSVTSIGNSAFSGCDSLASVSIPGSVTSIGNSAFSGCDSLASVSIPGSVTSIGNYAFDYCYSMKSMSIPDSVTSIGDSAFGNIPISCSKDSAAEKYAKEHKLRLLSGDWIYRFDEYGDVEVVSYKGAATAIEIPSELNGRSVERIADRAFYDSASLVSVKISDGVYEIGEHAFHGCRSLTNIDIPDSVWKIDGAAFDGCSSLTSIALPEVQDIGHFMFDGCSSLTSIEIPDGVEKIWSGAFSGCSSLERITIPSSVKDIGTGYFEIGRGPVFDGCDSLTIYCEQGSFAESYAKEQNIPYRYIGGNGNSQTPGNSNEPQTPGKPDSGKQPENTNPQGSTGNDKTPGKPDSSGTNTQTSGKPDSGKQPGGSSNAGTKKAQTITAKDLTKTYGAKAFSLGAKASGGGKLTYTVSDKKVAAVSNKGIVTIKGCGVTKITIKAAATGTYAAAEKTITLTVKAKKQTITAKNLTKAYGARAFSLGAKASGGGKLTYTVSDKKVATVSKAGRVAIKGCGVAKIKIKAAASKNHAAAAKTITLTVTPARQKLAALKSQKAKTLTVKWKKDAKANGYIIQYSTDKNFKKAVTTVTVKKNGTTAKTLSKLKGGKKYYVRVCSYKTSGGKSVKGAYSPAKPVTVKK